MTENLFTETLNKNKKKEKEKKKKKKKKIQNNVSEWPICIPFIQCNELELFSSAKHKQTPVNKYFSIFVT